MNKKADTGDMTMFLLFVFVAVVVIGGGVAFSLAIYFTQDYDFRGIDASLLNKRISECLMDGTFNWALPLEEIEEDLLKNCKLNKKVIEENFIILIEKEGAPVFTLRWNEAACNLGSKNKNFPVCVSSKLNEFTILTGSNQKARMKL